MQSVAARPFAGTGRRAGSAALLADTASDCTAIAQRLQQQAAPLEILRAVHGTPDKATAETLTALHASVLVALSECAAGVPVGAGRAWQWTVAYRRLVDLGVLD